MVINCRCGNKIAAPEIPDVLNFGNLKGKFRATVERVCESCGKVFQTTIEGRIEKSLKKN